jgi:tetratricopeptide (TPR) repeat protein
MDYGRLFPSHIRRPEEEQILEAAAEVSGDHRSRAVLLYGPGGIGKTSMVRQLAHANAADDTAIWLEPIDTDDSDYWLLYNLEQRVVNLLDPDHRYFRSYLEEVTELPKFLLERTARDTIVSHLGRIKAVFAQCYQDLIEDTDKTVVMVFDTVEIIRGTYLLLMLIQWIKTLPRTLFILCGRPVRGEGADDDPILRELTVPHQRMDVNLIRLGEFSEVAALEYLEKSSVAAGLTDDEKAKLACLTRGHPLWLAFAISYVHETGIPEEAEAELSEIRRIMPFGGKITEAGQTLHEEFKRRLVAPYRESDFWHEVDKRLAVVRQGVNRPIWQELMADLPPSEDETEDASWQRLLQRPWIRHRAGGRYVTLHDAVAEELAQRIIPMQDQDQQWRRSLWNRAARIYARRVEHADQELAEMLASFDARLPASGRPARDGSDDAGLQANSAVFVREAARLDARKRDLDRFKAACVYYQILSDFAVGSQMFLELFEQADRERDVLFRDVLAVEMQRFLPGAVDAHAFGDVISSAIDDFREWLESASETFLNLSIAMADYLINNEQPKVAVDMLDRLPGDQADLSQRFRLSILRGNAYMRIPERVTAGLPFFRRALALALDSKEFFGQKQRRIAVAYKELGFYYRNRGLWKEADEAYEQARSAISEVVGSVRELATEAEELDKVLEELASIQTNWAYVKGLGGHYRAGLNLAESAISLRRQLGKRQGEGISQSVLGEVYRYEGRFQHAWQCFDAAERIFLVQRNWYWLGIIFQEQAICLFQAQQDGINLNVRERPMEKAKDLIVRSLGICRDAAVRAYPSALNRAGRIFGQEDAELGLQYLAEGIEHARTLADGWFWFANLVEYVELSFREWVRTGERQFRDRIPERRREIEQAMSEYHFPDLRGRWNVVLGHVALCDWEASGDQTLLRAAFINYREGFRSIAEGGHVGSSGTSVIPGAFGTFGELFMKLPADVRAEWRGELRRAWMNLAEGPTHLLPRLDQLY